MDDIVQAALLFWLPFAFIPFGLWLSQVKSSIMSSRIGYLIALLGLVFVLASPWTVPKSPSSAVGHLLGFIAGPTIMILIGLFKIAYSGNVPVGRLSINDRNFGLLLFFMGIIWFSLMHWWEITPVMSSGEVNRYWLIFLPNLLISLTCLSLALELLTIQLLPRLLPPPRRRWRRSRPLDGRGRALWRHLRWGA